MTPDEVRQSITGWSSGDDNLEYTGEQTEAGADFALGVRSIGDRGGPVDLQVLHQGGDRITVRHVASIASTSAETAQKVLDQRPGWVTGSIDRSETGTSATVQTHVYLDGLNKHTFVQAASEVARTARLIGGVTTAAAAQAPPAAATQSYYAPQPQQVPAAQPVGAPTFSPQAQQTYTPSPAPQPQPQQASSQWVPTHSVPPQGMRAWAAPDPAGPVVANLAPGLPIQVAEVRGAWARVVCSNGWVGWIDGRLIGVAA